MIFHSYVSVSELQVSSFILVFQMMFFGDRSSFWSESLDDASQIWHMGYRYRPKSKARGTFSRKLDHF